ncbi:MAG: hypothetical protein D3914_01230 [Candidatus Electrothrix sp. LOE2]|nr:hypothetical protein [Candidatus Electrothrix sp. LOE2]
MQELPVFYCRYMDDWVIITDSRWQLRKAIRKMHEVLSELNFSLHPDKTSIGRVEKGFDFLGCRLGLGKLRPASSATQRVREKLTRLYEQGADSFRIGCYLLRWCAAFRGGSSNFRAAEFGSLTRALEQSFFFADPLLV